MIGRENLAKYLKEKYNLPDVTPKYFPNINIWKIILKLNKNFNCNTSIPNINMVIDLDGNTILHKVLDLKFVDLENLIKFLINKKADLRITNNTGKTPYNLACENKKKDARLSSDILNLLNPEKKDKKR